MCPPTSCCMSCSFCCSCVWVSACFCTSSCCSCCTCSSSASLCVSAASRSPTVSSSAAMRVETSAEELSFSCTWSRQTAAVVRGSTVCNHTGRQVRRLLLIQLYVMFSTGGVPFTLDITQGATAIRTVTNVDGVFMTWVIYCYKMSMIKHRMFKTSTVKLIFIKRVHH